MSGYNQYIGMRYVPIVDGEWSQSKAYEPLVVVVYNGNSYISKTYVPAGTLPTNETYWILAANYNAQVEQYRQEVRQYQQTVDDFDGDITGLQGDVTTLQGDVSGLDGRLDTAESDIDLLQERALDWDTVDEWESDTTRGMIYARRVGHVVSVNFVGIQIAYTANAFTNLASLPERFRPAHNHIGAAVDNAASVGSNALELFNILTTGAVRVYCYGSGSKQLEFTCTYIV